LCTTLLYFTIFIGIFIPNWSITSPYQGHWRQEHDGPCLKPDLKQCRGLVDAEIYLLLQNFFL
jgi:hypothetical protein